MKSNYQYFAHYYDCLTGNINYDRRAEYFDMLIKKFGGRQGGVLIDLACGTGSLSEQFCKAGYDVIGVDSSSEMLSIAFNKKINENLDIQYVCQDMTELDMFGTADITICALDSLNHLGSLDDIRKTFEKVSEFTEINGLFIFDMNTVHKHKNILADNVFIYETDDVYCVWENSYTEKNNEVSINLEFFERDGDIYRRFSENFSEIAFDTEIIDDILTDSGFEILAHYDEDSTQPVRDDSQRIVFAARKVR